MGSLERAFLPHGAVRRIVDDRMARIPVHRRHGAPVPGHRQGSGHLPCPDVTPRRQVIERHAALPGIGHMVLIREQAVRKRGFLNLQRGYPGLTGQVKDGRLIPVYHSQPGPSRGHGDVKGRAWKPYGICRLESVGQVIYPQGIRQSLLRLGSDRSLQDAFPLGDGLQRLIHSSRHIPLGQGVCGVFRQRQGSLALFQLLQAYERAASPCQERNGQHSGRNPDAPPVPDCAHVILR